MATNPRAAIDTAIDADRVAALAHQVLDERVKAVGPAAWGRSIADYLDTGPTLDDLPTPLVTLDASALEHNLRRMARWCADAGVDLAPHGKTTMAPQLWQRQLDAGASAITLATPFQVGVARGVGVRSVHLANLLLDPAALRWVATELACDPAFSFTCWVDSPRAVAMMTQVLQSTPRSSATRPIDVCVELGATPGRTGARSIGDALLVAAAVDAAPRLRLVGVSGYEGALATDASLQARRRIAGYLADLVALHEQVRARGLLDDADRTGDAVVTAGGSAYFDDVAASLASVRGSGSRVLLRSGAYLVHDDGFYRGISPLSRTDNSGGDGGFRSAMHGWARVLSCPEPALALLDAGKRDVSFDLGYPVPQRVRGRTAPPGGEVTALNDQHAFLRGATVEVGDVVRLGLSHPCTVCDRWTVLPVVDDADADRPRVVDLVRTFF